jgi:cellulose synthase/poly-beta-1,6-N-acetylglucosamine synthase-like glycosyltransferase
MMFEVKKLSVKICGIKNKIHILVESFTMISFVLMVIVYITIFLFLCYSFLIIFYCVGWISAPEFQPQSNTARVPVSVIVPARNEEKNIAALLRALEQQTYPRELVQVIVANDQSTDNTAAIAKGFSGTTIVHLNGETSSAHKKRAIEEAIKIATGDLIMSTDADCLPPRDWIQTVVSFREENHSRFVAAPVTFQNNSSMLQVFQALDFLVLQGITGASVMKNVHSMCNGANIAYEKTAFFEVKGFEGIDNIASGDDMLLMHKICRQFPGQVHYLKSKEAVVVTHPMTTWKDFFYQRIRWASKATFYDDKRILWALLLVYLFNLSFLALLVSGFWFHILWMYLIIFLVAKTIVELPFVYSIAKFFNKQPLLKYFFFFQPLHIAYTILIGCLGQFGKYEWKGRRVK